MDMLREHLSNAPRQEDYKLPWWGKVLGALGAGAAGAIEGPSAGIATAEHFKNRGYNRALEQHKQRGETLGTMAKYEDALSDRNLREREVKSNEKYRDTMGKAATARATRVGAQKAIPMAQQSEAWQTAAERMYATDPKVRKYLTVIPGEKGRPDSYVPKREAAEHWYGNEEFGEEDLKELKRVLALIDQEAQQYSHQMVDPYDRSDDGGFGIPRY
jgi:hypothetical protein